VFRLYDDHPHKFPESPPDRHHITKNEHFNQSKYDAACRDTSGTAIWFLTGTQFSPPASLGERADKGWSSPPATSTATAGRHSLARQRRRRRDVADERRGFRLPVSEARGRRTSLPVLSSSRRRGERQEAGLTGEAAAKALGVPRATLYRWERQPKRRSPRPHRVRSKNCPSAPVVRSSGCARIIRCWSAPSSVRSRGRKTLRSPTPPSGASSGAWWRVVWWIRFRAPRATAVERQAPLCIRSMTWNVDDLNPILYNHHRPHGAPGGLTPAQYLPKLQARDPAQSQR
jgi:Helix-turn-helix